MDLLRVTTWLNILAIAVVALGLLVAGIEVHHWLQEVGAQLKAGGA